MLGQLPIEEVYVYPEPLAWRWDNAEKRRLKKDVNQVKHPFDFMLTKKEKSLLSMARGRGLGEQKLYDLVRRRMPRLPIPAGTVVETCIEVHQGDRPEDDPNPLLFVVAPDGAHGLTFKNDTEAL